jgi:hypothetical protein
LATTDLGKKGSFAGKAAILAPEHLFLLLLDLRRRQSQGGDDLQDGKGVVNKGDENQCSWYSIVSYAVR